VWDIADKRSEEKDGEDGVRDWPWEVKNSARGLEDLEISLGTDHPE
jgi:hypothetical protein